VHRLIEVLQSIGVEVEWQGSSVVITPPEKISLASIDRRAAEKTRSILMFIGSLIHLFDDFALPQSGGCTLGLRLILQHLWVLEDFGVSITTTTDRYHVTHHGLHASQAVLYEASDTATENGLLAAAKIPGTSVIKYASANYMVQEVCGFLTALGVDIKGCGTQTLTITGVAEINKDIEYTVAEDPTDAMFFITAAITTKSELTIRNAPIEFLEVELFVLKKMGLQCTLMDAGVSENGFTKLADIHLMPSELVAFPWKIHARPYPALNADNLPFFAVIASSCPY